MLTRELKEKMQRFLQAFQDEFVRLHREHRLLFPLLKAHVAETLLVLRDGDTNTAWWLLQDAYRHFGSFLLRSSLHKVSRIDASKYAFTFLDIGIFAYRLEGSFLQLHDIVPFLWEKRKVFYPHLSGALKATYWFRCSIEASHKPEEALSQALRVRNELYEMFRYGSSNPFIQDISSVLNPEALEALKEILLHIVSKP